MNVCQQCGATDPTRGGYHPDIKLPCHDRFHDHVRRDRSVEPHPSLEYLALLADADGLHQRAPRMSLEGHLLDHCTTLLEREMADAVLHAALLWLERGTTLLAAGCQPWFLDHLEGPLAEWWERVSTGG